MEPGRKRIKYWQWLPILVFWLLVWQLAYILIDSDLLLASPLQVGVRLIVLVGESHLADRRSLNIAHYRRFSAGSRNRCCFGGFDRSHPTDVASAPAGYCCDSRNADRILYYFGFGLDDKGPGGHLHCAVDGGAHCLG